MLVLYTIFILLFSQIQSILDNPDKPYVGEEKVGALTAGDRIHWANTRTQFFFKGTNRQSLDAIEKAAFVVVLDEVPYEYDPVSCLMKYLVMGYCRFYYLIIFY